MAEKNQKVHRIDWLEIPDYDKDYLYEKIKKTDEGFLKGRAVVTNIGVFPYTMEDGSVQWELRPPEEVFNENSIETLKMKSMTNGHPKEMVNPENIKKLQVGNVGSDVRHDSFHLSFPFIITEEKAIKDVEKGKEALSLGYTADIVNESGIYLGMPYDAIQTNIKYNHLALVEKGRAGDKAVLKFDSIENVGIQTNIKRKDKSINIDSKESKLNNNRSENMALKTVKLDGVDYEAEKEVITALSQETKRADEAVKEVETSKKDLTTLQAKFDQLEIEHEKVKVELAKKDSSEELEKKADEIAKQKLVILDAAKQLKVDAVGKSDLELKKEIIIAFSPSAKEKMDAAEDVTYINSRFDAVLEHLDEQAGKDEEIKFVLKSDSLKNKKTDEEKNDSSSAYERMIKRDQELSQREGEK